MKIILLGKPGSGKGTQANLLSKHLHIPAISAGSLLRKEEQKNTPEGNEIKRFIDTGVLIPDEIIFKIMHNRLKNSDCDNGYILDGFPRNMYQAEHFAEANDVDFAIYLEVPDKTIIERISSRRECGCGKVYNLITAPPKTDETCDNCGAKLSKRADDNPSVIKSRLDIYNNITKPLLDYYKSKGILKCVSGVGDINKIFENVLKIIS